MERVVFEARPDFEKRNAEIGFDFGNLDGSNYWNEKVGYRLSSREVDDIESVTQGLFGMAMDCVKHLIYDEEYAKRIGVTKAYQDLAIKSWERDDYSLYGRFDFSLQKTGKLKLLEYNADTPTSLLESALIQYYWMKDRGLPDQFNSIHEKLIESWKFIKDNEIRNDACHFMSVGKNVEDFRTVEYLMDTATQAGIKGQMLLIEDLGTDGTEFYDLEENLVKNAFKLYPWEWLVDEEFADQLLTARTRWIEPAWKLFMSNKAFMVEMYNMYKTTPYILKASYEPFEGAVKKPIWSREGANITLPGQKETDGEYSEGGYIYQEYAPLPEFDGNYPMIGSWVIGDQAAGIGIREDSSLVTGNLSRFTPHWFE